MINDIGLDDIALNTVNILYPMKLPYVDTWKNKLTFMQYTGLTDENGIEIYEGDIVEGEKGWYIRKGELALHKKKYEVKWDKIGWQPWVGNTQPTKSMGFVRPWWEVVGNIYENPELINQ